MMTARPLTSTPVQEQNESWTREDYERLFVDHLSTISSIVAFVGRRRRLNANEVEEFAAHVNLKLIEDGYAVFRKFKGNSSLRTYLTVVIQRQFLDWRAGQWGKWRPSAFARRTGRLATQLEQLTMRQGLTFDEARTTIETMHGGAVDTSTLESWFAQLPSRSGRRQVGEDALQDVPASYGDPARGLADEAQLADAARTSRALAAELQRLPAEDLHLLKARFLEGLTVPEIARATGQDAKKLYRRLERLFVRLRANLEARGIDRTEVSSFLGNVDVKLWDPVSQ